MRNTPIRHLHVRRIRIGMLRCTRRLVIRIDSRLRLDGEQRVSARWFFRVRQVMKVLRRFTGGLTPSARRLLAIDRQLRAVCDSSCSAFHTLLRLGCAGGVIAAFLQKCGLNAAPSWCADIDS